MIRVDIISNAELNIAALEVSTGIELKLTSGCNIVNYKAREKNENVQAYEENGRLQGPQRLVTSY